MMTNNTPNFERRDENAGSSETAQPYIRTESTTQPSGIPRAENSPTITSQSVARQQPTDINARQQSGSMNAGQQSSSMNPALSRALMGGLIGATLGTLAGLVAGRRTSEGVKHAAKGVGDATKTIAGGVNQTAKGVGEAAKTVAGGVGQTAKGVGEAVKSVAEGVNYAVVGTLQDTAEGVSQAVVGTLDAVKGTASNAKQVVAGAADQLQDKTEDAKQSAISGLDAVQDAAEDIKPSYEQNVKVAKEHPVISTPQVTTTANIGMERDMNMQTAYISGPDEEDVVNRNRFSETETSLAPNATYLQEGEGSGFQRYEDTADI
ncbi:hypothetical protein [Trichocoleus sp. ST-U1]|uniref:hypothetical protein n=1 Tax=Trichocoleus sp. ST-U1 TaxID=2933928 RepID=UPI0032988181